MHKGIEYNIVTDAPFIGARICAATCSKNCPGCFNQHLITLQPEISLLSTLLDSVLQHPLCEGIILGGLEWTEQPVDLELLTYGALKRDLQVIIYTYHNIHNFLNMFPALLGLDVLIKCGEFRINLSSYYDAEYDVTLASNNQSIYNLRNPFKERR